MIRRPPRSTLDRSSAASDVYKRQAVKAVEKAGQKKPQIYSDGPYAYKKLLEQKDIDLSLIHISEPTRPY